MFTNGALSAAFGYMYSNAGAGNRESQYDDNGILKEQYWDGAIANSPRVSGVFADVVVGFGDTLSFGLTGYIRRLYGIDGVVNYSSPGYVAGQYAGIVGSVGTISGIGTAVNIGIRGLGGTRTLYHFTSASAAESIAASGVIRSGPGLYGPGVYATSVNSSTYATISGAAATEVAIPITGARALATPWPGTFRIAP